MRPGWGIPGSRAGSPIGDRAPARQPQKPCAVSPRDVLLDGLVDQSPGAGAVQRDGPAVRPALGRSAVQLARQSDDLAADVQLLGLRVEVVAVEGGSLGDSRVLADEHPGWRVTGRDALAV